MIVRIPVIFSIPDDHGKANFIIVGQQQDTCKYSESDLENAAKVLAYIIHRTTGVTLRKNLLEHLAKLEVFSDYSDVDEAMEAEYKKLLRECKQYIEQYEVK